VWVTAATASWKTYSIVGGAVVGALGGIVLYTELNGDHSHAKPVAYPFRKIRKKKVCSLCGVGWHGCERVGKCVRTSFYGEIMDA